MRNLHVTYQLLQGAVERQVLHLLSQEERRVLHTKTGHGFAAFYGQEIIGVTLFQMHDRRIILERIFVEPQYRLFGVGTSMLRVLCTLAESHGLDLLFSFEGEGIRDDFYRFVASTQLFSIRRQPGCTALLTVPDLEELCKKYPPGTIAPVRFFELNHIVREEFLYHLQAEYPDIVRELHSGHEGYRTDLCCCSVSGGEVQAVCLVKEHSHELELKLLYSRPGKGVLAGKALLETVGELGRSKYLKPMRLTPVGEAATKLLDGFCPSRHIEKYIYTAYYTGVLT